MQGIKNKLHVYGEDVQVPHHLHFGKEMLDRLIQFRHNEALINADTGESVTCYQLAQATVNIALSLTRMGVGRGDVISICSRKRMEIIPTILATFCCGAAYTTSDITYGRELLLHRLNITKPRIMFCSQLAYELHKSTFDEVGSIEKYIIYGEEIISKTLFGDADKNGNPDKNSEDIINGEVGQNGDADINGESGINNKVGQNSDLDKNGDVDHTTSFEEFLTESIAVEDYMVTPVDGTRDTLFILFSSGTTGMPKGVPWTHMAFLINSYSTTSEIFENSKMLNNREWYYTYGLLTTISCIRRGCTVVYSLRNEERDWWQAIENYKIKILQMAPISILELIKSSILSEYDVTSVEMVFSSSCPICSDQVDAVKKRLPNLKGLYQIYGTSEAGNCCNEFFAPYGPRGGSVGPPAHGFEIKVVDIDTRKTLGPNKRGEICFKSPTLMLGYLQSDIKKYLDEDGFFLTGDVGYYDNDKYFYIINRIKELIKYMDTSIAPAELEALLLRHSAVRDAAVTGAPREGCGEAPTAFIVLQPGVVASEEEIRGFLDARVAPHWRLHGGVRFVDKLPRGAGDKLDREALKLML